MMRTIVLKGYYGFRNFGDDLLFIVSWKWLRSTFPNANIRVCTESPDPQYLGQLVNESLNFIRNQDPVNADLVFHGGGGTYFDFREGPLTFRLSNMAARFVGPGLFSWVYNSTQRMRRRQRVRGSLRVGVGLGIGDYTSSSRRFPFDFVELAEFDLLGVRDPDSLRRLQAMKISSKSILASDLAFLTSYWMGDARPTPRPKRLGIVLRDWPYDNHVHHNSIETAVRHLRSRGFSPVFFSFDQGDKIFKQRFASMGEWLEWNPDALTIHEFVRALGDCELHISSRAHGVIVAGCLGIPCVSLEIEPKLKAIASLLPGSVTLVKSPFSPESVVEAVTAAKSSARKEEVQENARKVQAVLNQVAALAGKV